jgi:thiol-disulfide isomerase/thioredoxin
MNKLLQHRVLIAGILSPLAALIFYELVYETLTSRSTDLEHDWLFRLCVSTPAMLIPFLFTLWLVLKDRRQHTLSRSAQVGFGLAILSVFLAAKPVSDGITRDKQSRNQALQGVAAPLFNTLDILGNSQRLADHKGEVVLVNIWATWCGPCRAEMPKLDQLYRDKKQEGFVVFGISDEDVPQQRKFLKQIPVTYPLLTLNGDVPSLYREIARYPAIFLIDRQGRLQRAPPPGQVFEKIQAAVDALLRQGPSSFARLAPSHSRFLLVSSPTQTPLP